jgi:tetratricopeptide (TPR) repeat protein
VPYQLWILPLLAGAIALVPVQAAIADPPPIELSIPAQSLALLADRAFQRGLMQHQKGHLEAALEAYSEAIALDPAHVLAYVARGGLWGGFENYEAAIADYDAALALSPELAGAYGGRGLARYRSGDRTAGAHDLLHAAHLYRAQDRPSEYFSTLRVIQQLDP